MFPASLGSFAPLEKNDGYFVGAVDHNFFQLIQLTMDTKKILSSQLFLESLVKIQLDDATGCHVTSFLLIFVKKSRKCRKSADVSKIYQ